MGGDGANIPHVRLKEHACTRANAHADGQKGCSHAEELLSLSDCWLSSDAVTDTRVSSTVLAARYVREKLSFYLIK